MLQIGKYRVELYEEIAFMKCKIYNVYEHGDFYDCILEVDGVFELMGNYQREPWVYKRLVSIIKASNAF